MKQQVLGTKLAELRKAKGLTQEDVVAKCNINVRTLPPTGASVPKDHLCHFKLAGL